MDSSPGTCAFFHHHFKDPDVLPQGAQLNTRETVCNWTATAHLYIPNSRFPLRAFAPDASS
jgi:hypothetical protein